MPADASIFNLIRPQATVRLEDPDEIRAKQLQVRNLMQQGEMGAMQLQTGRRDMERGDALQRLFSGNPNATPEQVGAIDYKAGQELRAKQLEADARRAAIKKDNAAAGASDFTTQVKKLEHGAAILDLARDQASYETALQIGVAAGIYSPEAIAKFPQQFSPQAVASLKNAGMTRAQQLKAENDAGTLALKAANEPFSVGPAGAPVPNVPVQSFQLDKAKKGATNVQVKTDVKTGESLAAQVGPMMKDSTAIAEGAVKQADAAQRIVRAVDAGKIITGPTADTRLVIAQVGEALGVGGKDNAEKIANTRQALRGLAELTLQGRQQMKGQGAITESEGKLAEKAMSGEINFTAAEIKQLAKASERAARFNYSEHTRKMKVMQDNPNLNQIAPFYQGPAMPAEMTGDAPASNPVLTPNPDGSYSYGRPR